MTTKLNVTVYAASTARPTKLGDKSIITQEYSLDRGDKSPLTFTRRYINRPELVLEPGQYTCDVTYYSRVVPQISNPQFTELVCVAAHSNFVKVTK